MKTILLRDHGQIAIPGKGRFLPSGGRPAREGPGLGARFARIASLLLLTLLLGRPTAVNAQDFSYTTNQGAIVITRYTGAGEAVTVPAVIDGLPVTGIGNQAFLSAASLKNVTLPDSLETIGDGAFSFCTGLTRIAVPNRVTDIGNYAFQYCGGLTNVAMGTGVVRIGGLAFYGCYGLTHIVIPNSVTNLGNETFRDCVNLGSAVLGEGLTEIGQSVFYGCTKLASVRIGGRVSAIGGAAFQNCTNLAQVSLPNSVTEIGDFAFYQCRSLTQVTIPRSVTSLGAYAFGSCTRLGGVYAEGNAPGFGSAIFSGANNVTVYYLPGTTGWGPTFGSRPTAAWWLPNPRILEFGPSFGVRTNRFGFVVSWATNSAVVVEASGSVANGIWVPVRTNTLANGSFYFSDADWSESSGRFYRLRAP